MGILTRRQDEAFVISSDKPSGSATTTRAPNRIAAEYEVWTGSGWSQNRTEAMQFASLDAADEYVRANFGRVTG